MQTERIGVASLPSGHPFVIKLGGIERNSIWIAGLGCQGLSSRAPRSCCAVLGLTVYVLVFRSERGRMSAPANAGLLQGWKNPGRCAEAVAGRARLHNSFRLVTRAFAPTCSGFAASTSPRPASRTCPKIPAPGELARR